MYVVVQFWLDKATENLAGVSLIYQTSEKDAAMAAFEECCEIERSAIFRPIPEPYTSVSVPIECGTAIRQLHIISDDGSYMVSIALLTINLNKN